MRFVLASASPARLAVLRAAGVEPSVMVSGVDEDAVMATLTGAKPSAVVTALASAKARAVAETLGLDAVVVGCDSMLWIEGELLGKPATPEAARKRWATMAGGSGELLTGHAVLRLEAGEITAESAGTQSTKVRFATPAEDELDAYVASGEPLAVAGAFTIDGRGGWFVDGIEGDHTSVIGISLPLTRRLLADIGVSVADLWRGSADTEGESR
ncbi:septum formation inhibitor Maf [Prauserella marina]|uniref:Nucleoside triphosphate pyrophosphatase n=1 Tax=Prauserella marina TaxID=530584 RepID=A0A222VJZ4_9PSEU|nr:nucleoside triphosphate pyrophosphatase [Prauserella marina]ASR34249.1 septum formation inhibitor Maf [Prauserella marina]PWV71985.1 septum formation protein [Prauserella marina]SDD92536.1 septum formation protein [Prauserella marina]